MILMIGTAGMIYKDMEWYLMARMIRQRNDINDIGALFYDFYDRHSWNDILWLEW